MTELAPINFQAVILAAGKGTRMKSNTVKVLHPILGTPLLGHVLAYTKAAGADQITCVLGHDRDKIQDWMGSCDEHVRIAIQEEQLGTGHAVWCALQSMDAHAQAPYTVILSGDVPNLSSDTLHRFITDVTQRDATLGFMTAMLAQPAAYGRVVRDENQNALRIVEFRDASPSERAICEINAGVYAVKTTFLCQALDALCSGQADNAQGEFYLTDLIGMAVHEGSLPHAWMMDEPREMQGVNTRIDLAHATAFARERINTHWMLAGVTLMDPERTYIEPGVTLEQDVTLYPNVYLHGQTHIKEGVVIEHSCTLCNAVVGHNTHIKPGCTIEQTRIGANTSIGPWANLRPGSVLGNGCKIGNFVETKKAVLEDGAKASHLTYLGDASVGKNANIGAGTITCNYNGYSKSHTHIGAHVFIGSNSSLVAPVTIQEGSYVGAGSVITQDIPQGALGVARGRQRNLEGWAKRWRKEQGLVNNEK